METTIVYWGNIGIMEDTPGSYYIVSRHASGFAHFRGHMAGDRCHGKHPENQRTLSPVVNWYPGLTRFCWIPLLTA